jgi:MFS family permease
MDQPGFEFIENTEALEYTKNWMQQLGMGCMERTTISYIVQTYTVLYTVAGLLLFTLPDQLGPKKAMSIFGTIHIGAQFVIILVPNYWVRLIMMGVMGLGQLKGAISYCWLFSLIMRKDNQMSVGVLNAIDSLTLTVLALYFTFVSKEWFYLYLTMTSLGALSLAFMLLVSPDSPRWLLAKGRKEEAIAAFNKIAVLNGSQNRIPAEAVFVEAEDLQQQQKKKDLSRTTFNELSLLVTPEEG